VPSRTTHRKCHKTENAHLSQTRHQRTWRVAHGGGARSSQDFFVTTPNLIGPCTAGRSAIRCSHIRSHEVANRSALQPAELQFVVLLARIAVRYRGRTERVKKITTNAWAFRAIFPCASHTPGERSRRPGHRADKELDHSPTTKKAAPYLPSSGLPNTDGAMSSKKRNKPARTPMDVPPSVFSGTIASVKICDFSNT
jgi:hypothetical protein